ncbi:phosphotransferase [candidate division KSB1 bacterium]|nr:phosphotransferase [candidate division KSB1 bacterium]NIR69711.1 phosphotransferase [candidate division KSB1 bacterium]NIS24907.1 phosphotransferase [candidate division KSB1 bacterium]NIT69756.1 phosphotransferase [candidate division KSB1 bacterium]NIU23426.1 phosphotransferase [candidate division KSB1 bacterium]
MLETTLNTDYVPGTNLSGGFASADWRFLLPSLKFKNFLCLGAPSTSSLPVLSTMGGSVFVVSKNLTKLRKFGQECQNRQIINVKIVYAKSFATLPFANDSIDLIYNAQRKNDVVFFRKKNIVAEISRLLSPGGVIYCETKGLANYQSVNNLVNSGLETGHIFWLTPFAGTVRTALPLSDREIADYFFTNVMYGRSFKKRTFSKLGRVLSKTGLLSHVSPRRAVLVQHAEMNGSTTEPPEYLMSIAEDAGLDLTNYRFGLSTRGQGNSNKAIFYLFNKTEKLPDTVIKMTRSSEFNYRLENEYRVLVELKKQLFVGQHTFPEPLFLSYHNGLAVLGMRAIQGDAFRKRTQANENCPIAHDALDWIVELGSKSANNTAISASEASDKLHRLFERFNEIYQLTSEHKDFLDQQIASIALSKNGFPLVLQHGDPGTWNILVSDKNRVIFIDWEAGEPKGMPLWDLFYFFRTYASWVSRMQGSRDSIKNFTDQFLKPSRLSGLFQEVTARYCLRINLDRSLVAPLYYTCWMHRALKEATRLTNDGLESGHYVNILRLTIEQRKTSETLKQFLSLDGNGFE